MESSVAVNGPAPIGGVCVCGAFQKMCMSFEIYVKQLLKFQFCIKSYLLMCD